MNSRADALAAFLARSHWAGWLRRPLAGDASNRRYERLTGPFGDTLVLMDAAPDKGEDVRPFLRIAAHLAGLGIASPAVLAQDTHLGFLVLEDLGDDLFARVLAHAPHREAELYAMATDLLIALHQHPAPPDLPRFQPPFTPDFIALAHAWYRPGATGQVPEDTGAFCAVLNAALLAHANDQSVLILRDFHAENLVLRGGQTGLARVGVLDFQDAMAGHRAYDLVSLLGDARRDVAPDTANAMIARYIAATGQDSDAFRAACAVLSVQRNLRILGVFARLCLHFGKPQYVAMIPRVWGHLMRDLAHPALHDLRRLTLAQLPAPTPDHLNHLRARCATVLKP